MISPKTWPVWRTTRPTAAKLGFADCFFAALGASLILMLAGLVIVFLPAALHVGSEDKTPTFVRGYGIALTLSPLVSWVGFCVGAICYLFAFNRGVGGWAAALCIGSLTGIGIYLFNKQLIDGVGFFGVYFFGVHGALAAGLFWFILRQRRPKAFWVSSTGSNSK